MKEFQFRGVTKPGMTLFEFNKNTKELKKTEITRGENGKKEVMITEGCIYIYALNIKNAERRLRKAGYLDRV